MSTSKTGKHGHAKVHLVALDIFTNKKLEDICPSTHNMDVPVVKRQDYILMSIEDGFCSLMHPDSCDLKDDLKAPEGELGTQIKDALEKASADGTDVLVCFSATVFTFLQVSVVSACGDEAILGHKISTKGA